ncbi:conserved exported hypothetical protein [uncultured Desulfobacterium sp.]|uniref:SurA N-terminal domain-containing protein n=1 Tax=uncultured Desulfobacterium sp. TaxID=201089 RepID=A0A445MRS9_9BACT|nr:conserved exported hypothetical protein [uncultured Desulfobacterium sp.]
MKRGLFLFIVLLVPMVFFGCTGSNTEQDKILCKINEYSMPLNEFQRQLTQEIELERDFKLTQEAKKAFLEELIKKELLIQEAKKLKLDRRDKFIRAIERYWESTLIRDLMEQKNDEINNRVYVSEEEIDARCNEIKKSEGKDLSDLNKLKEGIKAQIREEKKTRMLDDWISNLRKNSNIEIREDLL